MITPFHRESFRVTQYDRKRLLQNYRDPICQLFPTAAPIFKRVEELKLTTSAAMKYFTDIECDLIPAVIIWQHSLETNSIIKGMIVEHRRDEVETIIQHLL